MIIMFDLVSKYKPSGDQQEAIDKLNNTPNRDLNTFLLENERHSGYCVARDMLIRFINEYIEKKQ